MKITPALLQSAVGCTAELAARFAPYLDAACAHYHVDTRERMAAFLAQIGHESGSLRYVREIADGSAYEGRLNLGNTEPGDGKRYRGRGLIQITGRANYAETTQRMRLLGAPDFVADPEALEDPRWAAWSAADWWHARGLNHLADRGEFDLITRKINGGTNGQADRRARWERAKSVLEALPAFDESIQPVNEPAPMGGDLLPESATVHHSPSEWDMQNPPPPPPEKPMPPFVIPAVVELAKLIPKLGSMFGGSEVAQRNVAAAGVVVDAVVGAVGASNAQEAVEKIQADPSALAAANKAVEGVWYQITEAGGGGIDGARKADAAARASGDIMHSPSFWVTLALLPLVYMVVGSVVGLWGESWPAEVRSAIATAVVSLVIGGAAGYYWGQTTSRNRSVAP